MYVMLNIVFTNKTTLQWLQRLQIYALRERILLIYMYSYGKISLQLGEIFRKESLALNPTALHLHILFSILFANTSNSYFIAIRNHVLHPFNINLIQVTKLNLLTTCAFDIFALSHIIYLAIYVRWQSIYMKVKGMLFYRPM
jgi:hypothetical protein